MTSTSEVEIFERGRGHTQLLRVWRPVDPPRASLVLVHGYAEHSGRYEHVGARLARAGIATWTTDLRGHGGSSGERASLHALSDLVSDARVALERARSSGGTSKVFLLGHSMGGLVATRLALEPDIALSGLVLSGAALGDASGVEPLLDLDPLPAIVIGSDLLSRDAEVARAYDEDPLNYRGPFRRETLRMLAHGAREVRQRWDELALPMLVLHGGDDAIVPPLSSRELVHAARSTDKQLEIYPGLRHEILNEPEGPEIVDRIVAWMLERA